MDPYTNIYLKINLLSFNSRGFDAVKQEFCSELVNSQNGRDRNELSILCNQENFLLRNNEYKIKKALPGYHIVFKPAVKDKLEGRPKNGMFIAIPNPLKGNLIDVSPTNWRVQAIILKLTDKRLLIVNTYFPQDKKTASVQDEELEEIFAEITNVLEKNQFDDVIWTGDINADFARLSGHTKRTDKFIIDWSLEKAWDKYQIDFTHECNINDVTYVSTIDHFFWSKGMSNIVENAGVYHSVGNTSDHHPVYCMRQYDEIKTIDDRILMTTPKPSWKKASSEQKENFIKQLDEQLRGNNDYFTEIEECSDVHCKNENHITCTDDLLIPTP